MSVCIALRSSSLGSRIGKFSRPYRMRSARSQSLSELATLTEEDPRDLHIEEGLPPVVIETIEHAEASAASSVPTPIQGEGLGSEQGFDPQGSWGSGAGRNEASNSAPDLSGPTYIQTPYLDTSPILAKADLLPCHELFIC